MRSITTKLILAFLSIGIISVTVIFITARWNTRQEFIRFLTEQDRSNIIAQLTEYYENNGTWAGAEVYLYPTDGHQGPGDGPPRRIPFILTDPNGSVLIANERYKVGDKVPTSDLKQGVSITEDGKVVGVLVPMPMPTFEGQPREVEFIQRINLYLLYGALVGMVIALVLGIILSRTLTRPIRELTRATHAVSEGDLSQQVPVRSRDELGELAQAFNKMSAELSRSVNARKQMTADIAHELRTPLSLILGHAEAVHDGVLPPSTENFEIIREEATRLEHLINDLRTLSLADAGELSMQMETDRAAAADPGSLLPVPISGAEKEHYLRTGYRPGSAFDRGGSRQDHTGPYQYPGQCPAAHARRWTHHSGCPVKRRIWWSFPCRTADPA